MTGNYNGTHYPTTKLSGFFAVETIREDGKHLPWSRGCLKTEAAAHVVRSVNSTAPKAVAETVSPIRRSAAISVQADLPKPDPSMDIGFHAVERLPDAGPHGWGAEYSM